jgi:hypothetical protein
MDLLDDPLTITGLAALNLRALLASRQRDAPQGLDGDGANQGIGNQGSAAFVFLGQSGTSAGQLSIPRNLRFGMVSA